MIETVKKSPRSERGEVIFSYEGKPAPNTIEFILAMSESKLKLNEGRNVIIKRVLNVVIELLQNIFNHGEDYNLVSGKGFKYALFRSGKEYIIVTENHIRTRKVKDLSRKLDNYLSMSDEELTRIYRTTLDQGILPVKGGAGLGLIHIIRKSGGNLEYKFSKIDHANSLFQLDVKIGEV